MEGAMSDRIVRALDRKTNLLAVACVATDVAREGSRRHELELSSAAMLGEGLTAGLMIASLQKSERAKVNVQIECDGPLGSLFVGATPQGDARGYIRNKGLPGGGRFISGPLLGQDGFISVLKDVEGDIYRGSVGLEDNDFSLCLERYFASSEQTEAVVQLDAIFGAEGGLEWIGGVLVLQLPGGDAAALERIRERLRAGTVEETVRAGTVGVHGLLSAVMGSDNLDLLVDQTVTYQCSCSRERVFRALTILPNIDLIEMITREHKASVDCELCGAHYEVSEQELRVVLDAVDDRDAAQEEATARERSNGTLN
jgi:molecular chaperone Hsp33